MVESEFVICHLRHQVRDLQSLLNYLESRQVVGREEHSYLQTKPGEVIGRLKEMRRFSEQRSSRYSLHSAWVN